MIHKSNKGREIRTLLNMNVQFRRVMDCVCFIKKKIE